MAVEMYKMQYGALDQTFGIINGDKVFWQRYTGSLCYTAQISVSSGDGFRLNDFKLADSDDINAFDMPYDGVWSPEVSDREKSAEIRLPQKADINCIHLYDNPSETDNVLDAAIRFDDGTLIHTGPLDITGSATEISVDKRQVGSFTVTLLKTEGNKAGLTEIEAYDRQHSSGLRYIKLQNAEGDFVYDYYIDRRGKEDFYLYSVGCPENLTEEYYSLRVEGEGCSAQITDGKLSVSCPSGRSCVVTVSSADGELADSVLISNPGFVQRRGQAVEVFWRYELPKLNNMTARVLLINLGKTISGLLGV